MSNLSDFMRGGSGGSLLLSNSINGRTSRTITIKNNGYISVTLVGGGGGGKKFSGGKNGGNGGDSTLEINGVLLATATGGGGAGTGVGPGTVIPSNLNRYIQHSQYILGQSKYLQKLKLGDGVYDEYSLTRQESIHSGIGATNATGVGSGGPSRQATSGGYYSNFVGFSTDDSNGGNGGGILYRQLFKVEAGDVISITCGAGGLEGGDSSTSGGSGGDGGYFIDIYEEV